MENVNNKRTEEQFGYKIEDLKPHSAKPIYRICEICGKEEIRRASVILSYRQTKCLDCSNKINASKNLDIRSQKIQENWKINGHPRQGTSHTPESRKKMSETWKTNPRTFSEEERLKTSGRTKGEKNPFYGKKHGEETRQKMSISAKKRAKTGKESILYKNKYNAKPVLYQTTSGEEIKFRSTWEAKVAKYLDLQNQKWEYEKEAFPVTYEYEGEMKEGSYRPDFFLSNGEIWEVKGYWRKDAEIKFQAFKEQYPHINIILKQKKELVDMGIL